MIYKFRRIAKPKISRQKINNFIPFIDRYFIKKSIASKDDKKAVVKPNIKGIKLDVVNSSKEEINSTIAARVIAGIPKIKENFAASFLFQPVKSAVEIVTPDRETPGKIANA